MEHSRETAKRVIAQRLAAVVEDATRLGLIATVELVSLPPPAVGIYSTEILVREARPKAAQ